MVLVKNYKIDVDEDFRIMPANSVAATEELNYEEAYHKHT